MADNTKIEWTDATWNPIRGCSMAKGSETGGCLNCYAARDAVRFSGPGMPYEGLARMTNSGPRWTGDVVLIEHSAGDILTKPLRWRRPRRVFVNSMSDLFHESLPFEAVDRVVAVMATAKQHVFQVLTKRPERMAQYLEMRGVSDHQNVVHPVDRRTITRVAWPLPNVWWGVSCENQKTLDDRMPHVIRALPHMALAWLSAEPLLGGLNLTRWLPHARDESQTRVEFYPGLSWVVAGGESGPNARPAHPLWFQSIADQCSAAGVPFLFKQWGEWTPNDGGESVEKIRVVPTHPNAVIDTRAVYMFRAGKSAAGRELNGRLWDEYPQPIQREGV
jgi:protein gp37